MRSKEATRTDKKVYESLIKVLPWDGSLHFIRHNNFAGFSFNLDRLNDLYEFEHECENPSFEFIDTDLEGLRVTLLSHIQEFTLLIVVETFPTNTVERNAVPEEWEYEQQERFERVVNGLHNSAKGACETYDALVKLYKRKLCIIPDKAQHEPTLKEPDKAVRMAPSIDDIVGNGESREVEFKTTLSINQHTGKKDPRMELAVLKTIAGFLNTNDGILVIGVSDDGVALGIDADRFQNEDKMHLHLVNLIKDRIIPMSMPFIHAHFKDYNGCKIMVIECSKAKTPIFVKDGNIERFYIRTGPSTIGLSLSQTQEYIKQLYRGL